MSSQRYDGFLGEFPGISKYLQKPNAADKAYDVELGNGEVKPIFGLEAVHPFYNIEDELTGLAVSSYQTDEPDLDAPWSAIYPTVASQYQYYQIHAALPAMTTVNQGFSFEEHSTYSKFSRLIGGRFVPKVEVGEDQLVLATSLAGFDLSGEAYDGTGWDAGDHQDNGVFTTTYIGGIGSKIDGEQLVFEAVFTHTLDGENVTVAVDIKVYYTGSEPLVRRLAYHAKASSVVPYADMVGTPVVGSKLTFTHLEEGIQVTFTKPDATTQVLTSRVSGQSLMPKDSIPPALGVESSFAGTLESGSVGREILYDVVDDEFTGAATNFGALLPTPDALVGLRSARFDEYCRPAIIGLDSPDYDNPVARQNWNYEVESSSASTFTMSQPKLWNNFEPDSTTLHLYQYPRQIVHGHKASYANPDAYDYFTELYTDPSVESHLAGEPETAQDLLFQAQSLYGEGTDQGFPYSRFYLTETRPIAVEVELRNAYGEPTTIYDVTTPLTDLTIGFFLQVMDENTGSLSLVETRTLDASITLSLQATYPGGAPEDVSLDYTYTCNVDYTLHDFASIADHVDFITSDGVSGSDIDVIYNADFDETSNPAFPDGVISNVVTDAADVSLHDTFRFGIAFDPSDSTVYFLFPGQAPVAVGAAGQALTDGLSGKILSIIPVCSVEQRYESLRLGEANFSVYTSVDDFTCDYTGLETAIGMHEAVLDRTMVPPPFPAEGDLRGMFSEFEAEPSEELIRTIAPYTEDEDDPEVWRWLRSPKDAIILGELYQNDRYRRYYWVERDGRYQVTTIDNLNDLYLAVDSLREGSLDVGVPPASEIISDLTLTLSEPSTDSLPFSHLGVLRIDGFTSNVLAITEAMSSADRNNDWVIDQGFPVEEMQQRPVTYPDTYYLVGKIPGRFRHEPAKTVENFTSRGVGPWADNALLYKRGNFSRQFEGGTYSQIGIKNWAGPVRISQGVAFHVPREDSQGFQFAGGDPAVAALPKATWLSSSWRSGSTPIHSLDYKQLAIDRDDQPAGTKLAKFYCSDADRHHPANWWFAQDFIGGGTFTEDGPGTFNPVMISDPHRIFAGPLWSYNYTKVQHYSDGPSSDDYRIEGYEHFISFNEVKFDRGMTEAELDSIWVFEIDSATYTQLKSDGLPELLADTHFTPAHIREPIYARGRNGRIYWNDRIDNPGMYGFPWEFDGAWYHGGSSTLHDGRNGRGDQDYDDENGPQLIDNQLDVDWGAISYAGDLTLQYDIPGAGAPAGFDAATAPRIDAEVAVVVVNQFGEESAPLLETLSYYENYPFAPATIDLLLDSDYDGSISEIRLYKQAADGLYYELDRQSVSPPFSSIQFEVQLGRTPDLAKPLVSVEFDPPPDEVAAATRMPGNFVMLGSGRTLYPSEVGFFHGFPRTYTHDLDHQVVAFGRYGDNTVVLTDGVPYIARGIDPQSLDVAPLDLDQGCISARSVVEVDGEVYYASHDGLFAVGRGGLRQVTEGLFDIDSWRELNPSSFHAYNWNGRYVCFYTTEVGKRGCFVLHPRNPSLGITRYSFYTGAAYSSVDEKDLFVYAGQAVSAWDEGDQEICWVWEGRITQSTTPKNPGRLIVHASEYPLSLSIISEGEVICENWAVIDREQMQLPPGWLKNDVQIRLCGRGRLYSVQLGDTTLSLKQV